MSLLLRANAIRTIEQRAFAAGTNLMERAGRAAADAARAMLANAPHHPARVLVLAGPGNNGGDAFEAALHLKAWGHEVTLCVAGAPAQLPQDASHAHAKWRAAGGVCHPDLAAPHEFDLIIDGLFGIGLTRTIAPPYSDWINAVNAAGAAVLALDVPSGLDADTGCVMGVAIRATRTLSFIADKPGLRTLHGADHAGQIDVATLDLRESPTSTSAKIAVSDCGQLVTRNAFAALLAPRARNVHKGSFGTLGILGGAPGMAGAALLAGRAALKLGAGKVLVGLLDERGPTVDFMQPELMLRAAHDLDLAQCSALVAGPGLGTSSAAQGLVASALATPVPLLLDADALNLIAADSTLAAAVTQRRAATLLTPHPQEAARLLAVSTADVQADRIAAACKLAQRFNACVVLKGAGSVIAAGNAWWINPTGNPGMASAGMGDVLSGLGGALLAQNAKIEAAETLGAGGSANNVALQSLVGAVFLHGAAADFLVTQGTGPAGLTASEVIEAARVLWNEWCAGDARHLRG